MKKYSVVCAGLLMAAALVSCGSSEKAYRKMYEKAQAADAANAANANQAATDTPNEEVAVVTPVEQRPATETVVVDNADNVAVRSENLSVVSGDALKAFSVVVGSYSVQANAEGMKNQLVGRGYNARVAYNPSNRMYRVVATSFDTKTAAVQSRNQLESQFPGAWLLYNKN